MSNKYPGSCFVCKAWVEKGQGVPTKRGKQWSVACVSCYRRDKEKRREGREICTCIGRGPCKC